MKNRQIPDKARGFDVWSLIGRTNIKVHRALGSALGEMDLSLPQHEVLSAVWRNPGITQRELSEKLLVVKSNVSALVTKLEKLKLLRRQSDAKDNRNKLLFLTAAGERLVYKSFEQQNQIVEKMAAVVSDKELVQLEKIMNRVDAALDELSEDIL